jgi:hypothetical protein
MSTTPPPTNPTPSFQIFINNFHDRLVILPVTSTTLVEDLRLQIQAAYGFPPHMQRLVFSSGKPLMDGKTLAECGVGKV